MTVVTRFAAMLLCLLCIVGCATPSTGKLYRGAGPKPTLDQAEQAIFAQFARTLKDPDSVKQFRILLAQQTSAGIAVW